VSSFHSAGGTKPISLGGQRFVGGPQRPNLNKTGEQDAGAKGG